MELALVLIGPLVVIAILTAGRAQREAMPFVAALQANDGPWLVAVMGIWGAFTKRPLELWHGVGFESFVIAGVYAAVSVVAWFLTMRPRVGTKAIGPLSLWGITAIIAQLLGSEASDIAMHERIAAVFEGPRLLAVIAFWIAFVGATWSSRSR